MVLSTKEMRCNSEIMYINWNMPKDKGNTVIPRKLEM